ncbi:hypothetical protein HKX48_006771 [Thoreauomyces humboldtii]|nr:hypothetical protein HKX48_006771 [Thoreauomyces humboldtii]
MSAPKVKEQLKRYTKITLAGVFTPIVCFLVYVNLFLATLVSRALAFAADQPWYPWSPNPKHKPLEGARPRVAIIGAGVSGVSSAAAAVASGVDVVIYEKEPKLGGVWGRVNKTSSLQFQALFYRFHPLVRFTTAFPHRDEIVGELTRIWKVYELEPKTRFNTPVESIVHDEKTNTYIINGETDLPFDGVVSAIGTCGEVLIPDFKDLDSFRGMKAHSSKMDSLDIDFVKGSNILVLGSGASAVEVVDYVLNELKGDESRLGPGEDKVTITVVARHDKWIMPRGILTSSIASIIPPRLGYFVELFLRHFWYGTELQGMTPDRPFYSSTPCLNTRYLALVREGKIRYIRGGIDHFDESRVHLSKVQWDSRDMVGVPARSQEEASTATAPEPIQSDIIFFATGFKKPTADYCPKDTWKAEPPADQEEDFKPPNLFCVAFPPRAPNMLFLNDAYVDAVATAGHIHIGFLTRLFLTFVLDESTRPTPEKAAQWVRDRRGADDLKDRPWNRQGSRSVLIGGYDRATAGLAFYSYGELIYWIASTVASQRNRWKYALFILGFNNSKGVKLARAYSAEKADGGVKGVPGSVTAKALRESDVDAHRLNGAIVDPESLPAGVHKRKIDQADRKVEVGR